MVDVEKVIKGLAHCTRPPEVGKGGNFCMDCPYTEPIGFNQFKCNSQKMMKDALELLKEQNEDATIMQRCREGSTVKYLGKGVIVLNYQWWIETLKRKGEFSPVTSMDDMQ